MTSAEDVRAMWARIREEIDAAARSSKQSNSAVLELSQRYRSLDLQQRAVVKDILAEWLLSDDETTRFDALALVDQHQIRSALPALQKLAERLEDDPSPGAPYEWAKVNRIIGSVAQGYKGP